MQKTMSQPTTSPSLLSKQVPIVDGMSPFSLLTTLVNSTSKETPQNLTQFLPSTVVDISSLANSTLYIICFSAFLLFLVIFFIRAEHQKVMKRNQRILLLLTAGSCTIQLLALLFRVVYHAIGLHLRMGDTNVPVVMNGFLIAMAVVAAFELGLVLLQTIFLFSITHFIGTVL